MISIQNDKFWRLLSISLVFIPAQAYVPSIKIKHNAIPSIQGIRSRVETLVFMRIEDDRNTADPIDDEKVPISRIDAVKKMLQTPTANDSDDVSMRSDDISIEENNRRNLVINVVAGALLVACGIASSQLFVTNVYTPTGFQRLPSIQFIAALGDPKASSGKFNPNDVSSSAWGLWKKDPGPRGVWLRDYEKIFDEPNPPVAPAGWTFDSNDWWLEEHGIIMEQPIFPIQPGRYLVTGGRSVTTGLTIDKDGSWKLDEGTLYDVTHLPCRSARYRPQNGIEASPKQANLNDFPVRPGATMPTVPGYSKQDYAVLFLVGIATKL